MIPWCPPPDCTPQAVRMAAVWLQPGQNPPETWEEYKSLLWARQKKMMLDYSDRAGVEMELMDVGYFLEKPEPDQLRLHLGDMILMCPEVERVRQYYKGQLKDQSGPKMSQEDMSVELEQMSLSEWFERLEKF